MSNREDMIAEATDLGLEFPGNISNIKLAEMLAEEKGEPAPLNESAPAGPATKPEPEDTEAEDVMTAVDNSRAAVRTAVQLEHQRRRKYIARMKEAAMKTHIVTLTNKDSRENDATDTAYLSFENQFFGLSKVVPLDEPVELETALIQIAASCTMPAHRDEIGKDGRPTGNKRTVRVKKYAISYSAQKPK